MTQTKASNKRSSNNYHIQTITYTMYVKRKQVDIKNKADGIITVIVCGGRVCVYIKHPFSSHACL